MSTADMEYQPDENEQQVLEVLREHERANPMLIREETGLRKEYVSRALTGLRKAGVVEKVTRGLYDHVPENDDRHESSPAENRRLRESIEQLKVDRDDLQDELDDAYERIHELEEQDRQTAVDADRARQALDDLEAALERGDRGRAEDALERARAALEGER